jgi:hypothetical protein
MQFNLENKPMKTLPFFSLFAFAISCSSGPSKADVFKMNVTDYESVNLKVPADVVWTDTDSPTCVVECSAETEKKIEVLMDGNTLVIKSREKNWGWDNWENSKIKITLTGKKLRRIQINGSGDFKMESFNDSEDFEYTINGSGDLKAKVNATQCSGTINGSGDVVISGKAKSYDLDINGSGDVKALDFECGTVEIEIAGSGDAQVHATESLKVKIAGSGDVTYKGDPKNLQQKVAGSGELRKI